MKNKQLKKGEILKHLLMNQGKENEGESFSGCERMEMVKWVVEILIKKCSFLFIFSFKLQMKMGYW